MWVLASTNTESEGGSWSPVYGECFIYSVWVLADQLLFWATLVGVLFGKLMEVTASTNRHFYPPILGKVFLHDEALKTPVCLRLPLLSFGSTGTRLQLMARSGEDLFPPVASRWLLWIVPATAADHFPATAAEDFGEL